MLATAFCAARANSHKLFVMMFQQVLGVSDLTSFGPRIVGATFVWAGIVKVIGPFVFGDHLSTLGWFPSRLVMRAVTATVLLEVGIGMSLLVGTAPDVVLPGSLALILALSIVSWWGVRSGRTNDCGCYGGFIAPSIGQSLALNGLFALLILAGWFASTPTGGYSPWQIALPVSTAIAAAILTEVVIRHRQTTGRALFDLNPLKPGRRFRHSWAGGLTSRSEGEVIVAFLGPDCPHCVKFVQVGNAMMQSPKLPAVVGVVATAKSRLDAFVEEKGIRFPMTTLSQSTFWRLAPAVPTAVVVESGTIKRVWTGQMPPDFVDRFKEAFFPTLPAAKEMSVSGRG